MRLVGTSLDVFKYLEPLYYDYRKMRRMNRNGGMSTNLLVILIHLAAFEICDSSQQC